MKIGSQPSVGLNATERHSAAMAESKKQWSSTGSSVSPSAPQEVSDLCLNPDGNRAAVPGTF